MLVWCFEIVSLASSSLQTRKGSNNVWVAVWYCKYIYNYMYVDKFVLDKSLENRFVRLYIIVFIKFSVTLVILFSYIWYRFLMYVVIMTWCYFVAFCMWSNKWRVTTKWYFEIFESKYVSIWFDFHMRITQTLMFMLCLNKHTFHHTTHRLTRKMSKSLKY